MLWMPSRASYRDIACYSLLDDATPCVQTDEPLENIRVAEKHVRFLWRWILMPLLFCLIGTIINFNQLPSSTILKAVGLIFAGGSRFTMFLQRCQVVPSGPGMSRSTIACMREAGFT